MKNRASYLMQGKGIGHLWAGLLAAPAAWALHLAVSYSAVVWVCESGAMLVLHLVTLACLLVAAAGLWLAWRAWQLSGAHWPDEDAGAVPRSRFLAMSGLILSAFFTLIIIAQWIPMLLLDPCMT